MKIKIKSAYNTKFGELWDKSFEDLFFEVATGALDEAGFSAQDLDEVYIGTMLSGETASQENLGGLFSSLFGVNIPVFRLEGACASGGLAVNQAVNSILSGRAKKVLVIGVEKMTDFSAGDIAHLLMQAASEEERNAGATFPSLYALMANAYLREYGISRENLSISSLISHKNACKNPNAQFRKEISIKDVLASVAVAEPLNLLDCSPISDGASAIVLSAVSDNEENENSAYILASESATDTLNLSARESFTSIKSTKLATEKAFVKSGIKREQIDLIELHDCFSIAALVAIEDMGFAQPGKASEFLGKVLSGGNGYPAVNSSGGLKACGHPVGATGVKQIAEIALQIQGKAGERQIEGIKYGLAQNIGGSGGVCVVHLMGAELRD